MVIILVTTSSCKAGDLSISLLYLNVFDDSIFCYFTIKAETNSKQPDANDFIT